MEPDAVRQIGITTEPPTQWLRRGRRWRARARAEHTLPAGALLAGRALRAAGAAPLALALLGAGVLACATPTETHWTEETQQQARGLTRVARELPAQALPAGGLRVRLVFDARADLDLYVTDPLQETVYFANTPTRSGGRLEADRRCGDPAPRIESVVFERPLPGRYRIGVDYPEACRPDAGRVAFVLRVDAGGAPPTLRCGLLPPLTFQPVAHELDLAIERDAHGRALDAASHEGGPAAGSAPDCPDPGPLGPGLPGRAPH